MKKYLNTEGNLKFTTATEIFNRLAGTYRTQVENYGLNAFQVARWCSDMIVDIFKDPVRSYNELVRLGNMQTNGEILIEDAKVLLPQNTLRMLDCYEDNAKKRPIRKYTHNGAYIFLPSDIKTCYADVDLLPIDTETGFPVVRRRYITAMVLACAVKIFEEDAAYNRVNQNFYLDLVSRSEHEIEAAMVEFTDEELDGQSMQGYKEILANMIINPYAHLKNKR